MRVLKLKWRLIFQEDMQREKLFCNGLCAREFMKFLGITKCFYMSKSMYEISVFTLENVKAIFTAVNVNEDFTQLCKNHL